MPRQPWQAACLLGLFLFFNQAMAVRPQVIYGNDDRLDYFQVEDSATRGLASSTVALVRTSNVEVQGEVAVLKTTPYGQGMGLCAEEPFYAQETLAFCSGFLVAPDMIVTAGHCVRSQANCEATRFVFGFRVENSTHMPRRVPAADVFACKNLVHSVANATGEDFAVIRLDRPVTEAAPLAYRRSGRVNNGEPLFVVGHPAGLPLKIAGGASVREVKAEHLVANLDTYGGNSGSAVFNSIDGKIEGILVRGEMDYTFQNGCRISNRCANDGCRGEDVTLFERVLPYLPKDN